MEQTKLEVSKPILSPTRSLDEGFESDPDRISTDSEHTTTPQTTPTFDLLQRSDRDGIQHTSIGRRTIDGSPVSSIICIDAGDVESDEHGDESSKSMFNSTSSSSSSSPVAPTRKLDQQSQHSKQQQRSLASSNETKHQNAAEKLHHHHQQQQHQQQLKEQQQHQQQRRVKSKAPLPPPNSSNNSSNSSLAKIYQPRSQSVDRIRSTLNDYQRSQAANNQQNILAGKFVRVTVDPKQQYLNYFKNYKSFHQNYHSSNSPRLIPSSSASNLFKSYHSSLISSSPSSIGDSSSSQQQQPSGGLLSLSNLSGMKTMPQYGGGGFTTMKSTSKTYHPNNLPSHHHSPQPQSHLVCWTQSMDPRRARK